MERLICLGCVVFGYIFGMFQSAYFIGKFLKIDVRKKGSGNLGTTNMFRTLGIRAGIFTFLGDILKVVIPIILVYFVLLKGAQVDIPRHALYLYTGLGVVLGHNFPFYLHFKGGKGVAATATVLITLGDWRMITIGVIVFFATVIITRYVSLGSLMLIGGEFIIFTIFTLTGLIVIDKAWIPDCIIIVFILAAMSFIQHRKNIVRLAHCEESKFAFKRRKTIESEEKNKQQ